MARSNTREIVELPHDESEELIEALFAHLYDTAHVIDHDWRRGDLVAWDNLAVQHAARKTVQMDGPVRTLRKVISPISSLAGIAETPKFLQGRLMPAAPARADPEARRPSSN